MGSLMIVIMFLSTYLFKLYKEKTKTETQIGIKNYINETYNRSYEEENVQKLIDIFYSLNINESSAFPNAIMRKGELVWFDQYDDYAKMRRDLEIDIIKNNRQKLIDNNICCELYVSSSEALTREKEEWNGIKEMIDISFLLLFSHYKENFNQYSNTEKEIYRWRETTNSYPYRLWMIYNLYDKTRYDFCYSDFSYSVNELRKFANSNENIVYSSFIVGNEEYMAGKLKEIINKESKNLWWPWWHFSEEIYEKLIKNSFIKEICECYSLKDALILSNGKSERVVENKLEEIAEHIKCFSTNNPEDFYKIFTTTDSWQWRGKKDIVTLKKKTINDCFKGTEEVFSSFDSPVSPIIIKDLCARERLAAPFYYNKIMEHYCKGHNIDVSYGDLMEFQKRIANKELL